MSPLKHSFSVVLLAAGEGSRLGKIPKSLLRVEEDTLLERQHLALSKAGAAKIVIVTGYYFSAVEAEIERWQTEPTHIVRNAQPERGQHSSVLLGLQSLVALDAARPPLPADQNLAPILIALVDQPLINAQDYQALVTAFYQRPPRASIVYPAVDGQRGNPVALSEQACRAVLQSGLTCRAYIDQHADQVHRFTTQNDHFIVDLDQAQDLEQFRLRTGKTLRLPNCL